MKRILILLILLSVALVQVVGGPEPAFADSLETLRAEVARIAQTVDDEVPEPVDSGVGASIAFAGEEPISLINGDHRFPMMSTVKIPVSMQALDLVSQGKLTLEEQITITDEDLSVLSPVNLTFPQAPTTTKLYNLIWTAIVDSDNTTPNTMMRLMIGPKGVEAWVQEQGVNDISVERNLNRLFMDVYRLDSFDEVIEFLDEQDQKLGGAQGFFIRPFESPFWDDPRDTITPDAMAQLLSQFMAGEVLDAERTEVLIDIMEQTRTGKARLQGMLPPGTVVGDKTGTGHDSVNDVGWIRLPDGRVLVIAVYNCNKASFDTKEQVIAQIARAAYDWAIYAAE
ncbi:MAG: serine hydrolase [Hormoscilla sp. GM7CHS1pb]|nr:serine hydrolase [Hormoscilla sp. GM7CHS1pb]